jgi:hypothetical protein
MYAGSHIKRVLLLFDVNKSEIYRKIWSENLSINFNANPLFNVHLMRTERNYEANVPFMQLFL